jgi:predicted RNA binding protein YcfA (HicA-like mRNA interferase family)
MERGSQHTSIPVHGNRSLKIGTLRSILRDIDMGPDEFRDLWNE